MKSFLASKTIWFNVIFAVVTVLLNNLNSLPIPADYMIVIQAVLNIILRFVTTQPIALTVTKVDEA